MEEIIISVIVPVYNVEKYLDECIQSVLKQTYDKFELICVNDGSTDYSLDILEKYCEQDQRIKVITQKNQGLSVARNTGIEHAKGKYLLFLDGDDLLEDYTLNDLCRIAEEKNVDIINFDASVFFMNLDMYDGKLVNYYLRNKSYGLMSGKQLFTEMMQSGDYCDSACLLFLKRKWLEENKLKFYPGILYEDCLFTTQCMLKVEKIVHINNRYYRYRIRENSIMTSELTSKNMYGRLICYHHFCRYLYTEQFTSEQELALTEFTRIIYSAMKVMVDKLSEVEVEKLAKMPITGTMRFELEQIGLNWNRMKKYSEQNAIETRLIETIKSKEINQVEIYGAGVRGKRFLEFLRLNEIEDKVKAFVVTKRASQPDNLLGIPIKSIDEGWKIDNKSLVIISFMGEDAKKLFKKYKEQGYKNILIVDNAINEGICRNICSHLKLR
ncbi:putative glycosyltransferase EpsJ [Lachnospiraceae bacterium]|nr:putative glycosyltransferase EpsJ [Lachnospiraceae bacterium]